MTPQADKPNGSVELTPDLLGQIIEQYEQTSRPFGKAEEYSEEDAKALGLPSPKSLNFLRKYVKQLIGTPFIPRWMYDAASAARSEEDRTRIIAGCFMAVVVRGREMGFASMESTEVFYKAPDGRLGLYSKPMTALMLKAGAKLKHTVDTDDEHQLHAIRTDGNEYTSRFSHADAQRAGLIKGGGGHEKYPRRMLKWRCLSDMFNTLFPDLSGNGAPIYTAEELIEEFRGDRSDRAFQEKARELNGQENPFEVTARLPQSTNGPEAQTNYAGAGVATQRLEDRDPPSGSLTAQSGSTPERQHPEYAEEVMPDAPARVENDMSTTGGVAVGVEQMPSTPAQQAPRGRGRPPGSGSKTKTSLTASGANGDIGTSNSGVEEGHSRIPTGEGGPPRDARAPLQSGPTHIPGRTAGLAAEPGVGPVPYADPDAPPTYRATDDDVPAVIGAQIQGSRPSLVIQAGIQARSQLLRMTEAIAQIARHTKRTPEETKPLVQQWMQAFTNLPTLGVPPQPYYDKLLPAFEGIAASAEFSQQMMRDPHVHGLGAGTGWDGLLLKINKWPTDKKAAMLAVAATHYPYGAMDLWDWLFGPVKVSELMDLDVLAFLKVARIKPALAMELRKAGQAQRKPLIDLMKGLNLDQATEQDVVTKLAGGEPTKEQSLWQ